jgi:23S rRNA (uracil747-C5)-methyltransferase
MRSMTEPGKTEVAAAAERYESASCALYDAGTCRSCGLLALSRGHRASSKTASVLEVLRGAGIAPALVEPLLLPSSPWGSRAKIKVSVTGTVSAPVIGIVRSDLKAVELAVCPLSPAPFRALLEEIRGVIGAYALTPYEIEARRGELKGLIVMSDSSHSEGILRFVLRSTEAVARIRKAVPAITAAHPWVKVVSCNIQPLPAALLEGDEEIVLTEQSQISAQYGPVRLLFSPQSFMQVTPDVAAALYAKARAWADEFRPGRLLDIFCGVGGFSLSLAPVCESVTGVEISHSAVQSAAAAAAQLGLSKKARFLAGDALRMVESLAESRFDTVLVNPPRRGLSAELVKAIAHATPEQILYSSCNPETFARDVSAWRGAYTLQRIALFDMFPLTEHCEVLGLLTRA